MGREIDTDALVKGAGSKIGAGLTPPSKVVNLNAGKMGSASKGDDGTCPAAFGGSSKQGEK